MTDHDLTRRRFMRLGLAAGSAGLLAACGWDGGKLLHPALGTVSRLNDWVGEHVIHSNARLAREYPAALRTGAAFPAYFVSRRMPILADPGEWALEVGGEVEKPMRLTLEALRQLPRLTYTVKHHCVEGWTAIATWSGVPFHALATLVRPTPRARFVRFDSFDANYYNGWDMTSVMHPQTILAWAYNDRPLMPDHGAPLRLYSPVKLGYKLTKYLTRVSFTRDRPGGYWEDRGYPWLGGV